MHARHHRVPQRPRGDRPRAARRSRCSATCDRRQCWPERWTRRPSTRCRSCCTSQRFDELVLARLGLEPREADLGPTALVTSRPRNACEGEVTHRRGGQVREPARRVPVRDGGARPRRAWPHGRARGHALGGRRGDRRADNVAEALADADGILVPGGFGERAFEGKIAGRSLRARERRAVIWASAWGCRPPCASSRATWPAWPDATSAEFGAEAAYPVIDLMPEQEDAGGQGRHHAPGRVPLPRAAGDAGLRGLRRRGGLRAAPPPLRGEQRVPRRAAGGGAHGVQARLPTAGSSRWWSWRIIPGSWPARATPSSESRPTRPHPLFLGFVSAAVSRRG